MGETTRNPSFSCAPGGEKGRGERLNKWGERDKPQAGLCSLRAAAATRFRRFRGVLEGRAEERGPRDGGRVAMTDERECRAAVQWTAGEWSGAGHVERVMQGMFTRHRGFE